MNTEDNEVRNLLVDHIANFAENLFNACDDEQGLHDELDRFLNFFCNALEAAERDGRHSVLSVSNN